MSRPERVSVMVEAAGDSWGDPDGGGEKTGCETRLLNV